MADERLSFNNFTLDNPGGEQVMLKVADRKFNRLIDKFQAAGS